MQFAVPQFIESEVKIFAFLTVRQFIITLLSGGLIVVIVVSKVNLITMIALIFLVIIVGGGLAFVKINGQHVHEFTGFMFTYVGKPPIRVWRRELVTEATLKAKKEKEQAMASKVASEIIVKAPINRNNLSQIALIVDTGGAYRKEN